VSKNCVRLWLLAKALEEYAVRRTEELSLISAEKVFRRLLVVGAVLMAYGVVVIFAGHGAGPVALLLIFGLPTAWLSSQILGWPGALLSLAALFATSEPSHLSLRFWGASLLVLSVGMFVSRSEVIVFSALTALPLLGIWLYLLWRYVASRRAIPSTSASGRPRQVTWAVAGLGISLAVEAVFLVPVFSRNSMALMEVLEVLQFLVLIVLTVQTWRGENWARWGLLVLIVANRIFFAQALVETIRQLSVNAMIAGTWLLLDIAILSLLFTRPASWWLRGCHTHTGHGP
jgi:hypothetical protein